MSKTLDFESKEFHYLPVEDLMLDPENPRLPEEATGWSTAELVDYFHREHALDEITESMLSNGFFQQEALIVLAEPDRDHYIVVEGNRRLAALMYIHGAVDDYLPDPSPTEEQLERLESIPCIAVASRDDVRTYLGFRHIGGIKDWSPEAKARFVAEEVDRRVREGDSNPFKSVGKAYGSNSQGVRNAYIALIILRYARNNFGMPTHYVQQHRFGVWQRCLNSQKIKAYVGFGNPSNHEEVHSALGDLDEARLAEVLADLSPQSAKTRPLVYDSRQVTAYGEVLNHEKARKFFREYEDLDAAIQILQIENLPDRIFKLAATIRTLVDEVIDAPYTEDLDDSVHELWREIKKMRNEVNSKGEDAA